MAGTINPNQSRMSSPGRDWQSRPTTSQHWLPPTPLQIEIDPWVQFHKLLTGTRPSARLRREGSPTSSVRFKTSGALKPLPQGV